MTFNLICALKWANFIYCAIHLVVAILYPLLFSFPIGNSCAIRERNNSNWIDPTFATTGNEICLKHSFIASIAWLNYVFMYWSASYNIGSRIIPGGVIYPVLPVPRLQCGLSVCVCVKSCISKLHICITYRNVDLICTYFPMYSMSHMKQVYMLTFYKGKS